jgi:DNA anti-recombination protein RmuC
MSDEMLNGHGGQAEAIETRMGSHVEDIMSAARKAAAQLQSEVERACTERATQIETAAARQAHAVRMRAEAEATSLRAQMQASTQQYVAASRRLVDEFAKERMHRIADIGDRLGEQAQILVERLTRSEELARQLDELRSALGNACELIAVEAAREGPDLPELSSPVPIAGTEPEAGAGTDPDADAGSHPEADTDNTVPKELTDDA